MTTHFYNSDLYFQILPGQFFVTDEARKDEIPKHCLLTAGILAGSELHASKCFATEYSMRVKNVFMD